MDTGRFSLPLMTLRAMWRRKWGNSAIALMLLLSVCSAIILQQLTLRQEAAREQMIQTTDIRCIVTDANGMNSENLQMLSSFVERLMGRDERYDLGAYVDCVQALSVIPLTVPENYELHRILSFASDKTLSALSGAKITLYDGWTEAVFLTDRAVCLIPEGMATDTENTLIVQQEEQEPLELTVIGTVTGGAGNEIYCPFYLKSPGTVRYVFAVKQCSFSIRDNKRLEESKAAILETFVEPSLTGKNDGMTFGVLIQDETYRQTLEKIDKNLTLLRLLLPLLLLLCFCIGGFTSYLSTKGRVREFAVMRCLGMSPAGVFSIVFEEFLVLALCGGTAGFVCGYLAEGGSLSLKAVLCALGIVGVYLIGAAAATVRICNVNVMKLMKGENKA